MTELLHAQSFGDTFRVSSPQQPTIVLIHGLFGNSDNLAVIRRHFETTHHVLSVDLPDHGQSPRTDIFSFDHYAKMLLSTLKASNINICYVVAHSLGGKVAMRAASLASDIIKKLVVMDIAPVKYEARHHNVIKGLSSVNLSTITDRKAAMQCLSDHIVDSGTIAFLLKSLYQDDKKAWQWRFNLPLIIRDYPLLSDWPFSGELYNGDVTFIKGKNSDYIGKQHQATIMQQFPKAKAKIVDAGHWLHAEKPQLVNTLLTRILLGTEK
ncbi:MULTISPECIES: alpha/beta fold hydrolase [Alteromonadaceae]|jgi:esterase|uniref:Alpha/beta fold hydrolase n=1 Tax=Brumicola blandensis TaxID=3075611 RepID=A0AAW8QXF9_9ALTE|nr:MULTISPECIES: alpha/beta fold hydrolase [unclassified Alteromonas]MDT0581627.1 alpha/beta fold hydrolase [Alteromonas sp. W409]MDT0627202.1 alpha/beta fold hydrolase [Alteromonas sp. W364]